MRARTAAGMIKSFDQVTSNWLAEVTGKDVVEFSMQTEESNWARHARILTTFSDGTRRKLWLKICSHPQSGKSEVDYYLQDYVNLPAAPLVNCYAADYEPGWGYCILLDDLSDDFQDRKVIPPTLEHGLALAESFAIMHGHYWESRPAKDPASWEPEFARLQKGAAHMEAATGRAYAERFAKLQVALTERWSNPAGMSVLHGDVNPTNVLTPKGQDKPVYFLDRQPLDGVTPYGVAVYDLAYSIAPWWNQCFRKEHEEAILRHWLETLNQSTYSWEQAQADWALSVEHCLLVPIDWCVDPTECESMRGLWGWQLENLDGSASSD